MKLDDIVGSFQPPAPAIKSGPVSNQVFEEVKKLYHLHYVPGLSAFFETQWYDFRFHGQPALPRASIATQQMASMLSHISGVPTSDTARIAVGEVLDTQLVWRLVRQVYGCPAGINAHSTFLPRVDDPTEARNRVWVVETLLSGEYLAENPLASPAADANPHRVREFRFWYHLGEFLCVNDGRRPGQSEAEAGEHFDGPRGQSLAQMRALLDGRENRDVLYSAAVARAFAPWFDKGFETAVPAHLDEAEPRNRLAVANRFLLAEAGLGKGPGDGSGDDGSGYGAVTVVAKRFAQIAVRAYVDPGVNVSRLTGGREPDDMEDGDKVG